MTKYRCVVCDAEAKDPWLVLHDLDKHGMPREDEKMKARFWVYPE